MRILITGANGLVGQGVLHECLQAADVSHVTALGRHSSGHADPKLEESSSTTSTICAPSKTA